MKPIPLALIIIGGVMIAAGMARTNPRDYIKSILTQGSAAVAPNAPAYATTADPTVAQSYIGATPNVRNLFGG